MDTPTPFKPLTKEDVAEVFRVTPRTVENWVGQGLMPAPINVGNRVFWHPDVFWGWLNELLRVSADRPARERVAESMASVPKSRLVADAARDQLRSRNLKRLADLEVTDEQPS
ncbi:helix-turn-helix transcriptional regulator [Variovorax sp. N23]|uniref:helix-turn-helix transcriptional regulator n=1 Tax=Variovorax sp. N23 TaxID=2980555 RepID=UPI0021C6B70C|nr:helix-turn-helix domain-containing protein [Variovorax sp. N23]MCU4119731.1 helix-turn-helix domain-containing protein [Variovorax sp. N23]